MAKSFNNLVKRTASKKVQTEASHLTKQLLAELLLSEIRQLTGTSQQQVADALGIKQPSLSKLESKPTFRFRRCKRLSKP